MPTRAVEKREEMQLSEDVRFLLVVLLLFLFYPVGLVLMWVWTPWPVWVKLLISLPLLVGLFLIFVAMVFVFGVIRANRTSTWQMRPAMQQYYYRGEYMRPMMQLPQQVSPSDTPQPTQMYY